MDTKIDSWRHALAEAFSSVDDLCRHLQIDPKQSKVLYDIKGFPLRAPRHFVDRMRSGDPQDPLLKQVLPISDELLDYPDYNDDPVGDLAAVAAPGVIHKYHGRVLLIVTGACAIHCRYCFRRNFPYSEQQLSGEKLKQALAYIKERESISEVILSGGDPLLLSDEKLGRLLRELGCIPHLRRIRVHTRVPIVLPSRVNSAMVDSFSQTPKQIVFVIHANHASELSPEASMALRELRRRGVTLLNQSVLLKDVNDDARVLCELSEQLFALGVLPYYLHMLDHASGVGHFAVTKESALAILRIMREHLPGYLVPRLVREEAGASAKTPLCEFGGDL